MRKLLIINPGSPSTKIGVFEDEKETYFDETKWFLVKPTDNYISLVLKKTATLTFIDDYDDSFYRELIGIIGNKITTTIKPPTNDMYP